MNPNASRALPDCPTRTMARPLLCYFPVLGFALGLALAFGFGLGLGGGVGSGVGLGLGLVVFLVPGLCPRQWATSLGGALCLCVGAIAAAGLVLLIWAVYWTCIVLPMQALGPSPTGAGPNADDVAQQAWQPPGARRRAGAGTARVLSYNAFLRPSGPAALSTPKPPP